MPENGAKIFSLAEANDAVRELQPLTEEVIGQLDGVRERYHVDSAGEEEAAPAALLRELAGILSDWSEKVTSLGAQAKGYFTVDFQSADPELLYCWTYGEDQIAFTHKVWENFSHRRPLSESAETLTGHLKWIN